MKIKPDPRNARKHLLDNLKAIEKSLIDEHYSNVIIARWQNYTGKEAVKYNESN